MNLLVTIPSLEVGGAEIFLVRLLNYLSEEKEVRIFLLDFEREKRDPDLMKLFSRKIKVINNPLGNIFLKKALGKTEVLLKLKRDSLSYKFYSVFLKHRVRKHKISLIHSHLYRSDRIISHSIPEVPAITTLHGCYNSFEEDRYEEMFRILSGFKAIVYIAKKNLDPILKLDQKEVLLKKTVKIYNGIELKEESPANKVNTIPKLLVVSRCIAEKGWDIVIEAAKQLNAKGTPVELNLVGDGEYLDTLKKKYAHEPFIIFHGKVMDVSANIVEADICCFPSVYPNESFPNSILEYMMHGKVIISNRIGEVESMLTMNNGSTCAKLAPEGAGKDELISFYYKTIEELLKNKAEREQLEKMTKENIKKFDLRHAANAYMKLYETCGK